ncbi:subunit I/II of b(o/a)3-type cytochrome C oxidase [Virgibacillus alimentarius]|uniref:Subunit I/II of b(O/a)3-type cytochrome C oxidase n=1 Tax=Virgibacillus alimentarius TaxID=698769 RepID=A0ABS4S4C5_9BACI|nr:MULTISPECIES: subunit I/II of b(o/a)3-type cytochrome C oxidase [Virgibacillus]MBP2256338.1 hypothetical protein [Virgibacillus alimentarius]HLR66283.1 cytochrome c oxidase subunit 2A [Virgibacillus sp.]
MPKAQVNQQSLKKDASEDKTSLKGTFVSVMLLGGFIILSWLGVWGLYISR